MSWRQIGARSLPTAMMTWLWLLHKQVLTHWGRVQHICSLQNKYRTADPDLQNFGRSGKLFFFTIYKFWKNCASVRQVSDLILKTVYASVNWVSIGSGNGLSPLWPQAIFWNNADLLSIGPLGTNLSEIQIKIWSFSFTEILLKVSSVKRHPFCPGRDKLNNLCLRKVRTHCFLFYLWVGLLTLATLHEASSSRWVFFIVFIPNPWCVETIQTTRWRALVRIAVYRER